MGSTENMMRHTKTALLLMITLTCCHSMDNRDIGSFIKVMVQTMTDAQESQIDEVIAELRKNEDLAPFFKLPAGALEGELEDYDPTPQDQANMFQIIDAILQSILEKKQHEQSLKRRRNLRSNRDDCQ